MKKIDKVQLKKIINKYLIGEILVLLAVLVIDLVSKLIMQNWGAKGNDDIVIIKNVLELTYVKNYGAAFSMLEDKMWLFILLASLAVVGFSIFLFFVRKKSKFLTYTVALLIAGTLGNLIDRIAFGYVRDFIYFASWFVCNIADIALTVGAVMLCVYYIFLDGKKPKIEKIPLPEEVEVETKNEQDDNEITAFHMDSIDESVQDFSNMKVEEQPFDMSEIMRGKDE